MKSILKLGLLFSLTLSASAQTSGSVTSTNSGLFTNTQMNEYVQSILNSCSPLTEYQALQGAQFTTEAITGCIAIPSTSTVHQPNAIAGYINNASTASNGVAVYGQSRATAVNAHVWGANFVASDGISSGSNFADNQVLGAEIDIGNWNASSVGAGITFGGTLQASNNFVAIQVPTISGQPWGTGLSFIAVAGQPACKYCIKFLQGATTATQGSGAAIQFNPVASGTNQNSQGIDFASNDPVSGANTADLYETAAGSLFLALSKSTGALQFPRVQVIGAAPTCTFTSGGGTTPSCTVDTGSTDTAGIIIATTGTGVPAGTGTITLTFSAALGTNKPVCQYQASDHVTAWNGLAVFKDKTPSTTSDLFTWTNGTTPTALSTSSAYWINYECWGK